MKKNIVFFLNRTAVKTTTINIDRNFRRMRAMTTTKWKSAVPIPVDGTITITQYSVKTNNCNIIIFCRNTIFPSSVGSKSHVYFGCVGIHLDLFSRRRRRRRLGRPCFAYCGRVSWPPVVATLFADSESSPSPPPCPPPRLLL